MRDVWQLRLTAMQCLFLTEDKPNKFGTSGVWKRLVLIALSAPREMIMNMNKQNMVGKASYTIIYAGSYTCDYKVS